MKRFNWITAAAVFACCGLAMGQEKPADKPATDAQPAKTAPAKKTDKSDDKVETKKLAIGDAAPALSVEKWVKGDAITGFEKGKVYIVEFWATWCGPCKASMPHLTELQKEYKSKGLTIIGMASPAWDRPSKNENADEKVKTPLELVEAMVKEKGDTMGYTVAWDKEGATNAAYMKASKQRGIPTSFVVDQKGNIAWIGHPMQLDFVIDDVLAGKWDYKTGPEGLQKMQDEADKLMGEDADGDPKAALKAMGEFEAKYPKMAKQMVGAKYMLQLKAEQYTEAYKTANILIDEAVARKDAMTLNQIAWGIVDPEGTVKAKDRNIDVAMKAATKAVEITEEKDGAILDTLARCYWIKGDKVKAIDLQKKAIAALTKDQMDMKEQLQETLKEYEGGKN
jgi:thiol-disulfide isomerase/thioredoxin